MNVTKKALLAFLVVGLAFLFFVPVQGNGPAASLQPGKEYYFRDELYSLNGSGFDPFASVSLVVSDPNGGTRNYGQVVANGNGQFSYTSTVGYNWPYGIYTAYASYGDPPTTVTCTFAVIPGPVAHISLTPSQGENPVGTPHTLMATVTDPYGSPMEGVPVLFEVSGAHSLSETATTNASGVVQWCYTATTPVGTDTIMASASSPGYPIVYATATKTWLPGDPSEIVLTQNSDTNTVGQDHVLTATVKDQYGNPVVDGQVVNFVVDRAGKSGTANTTGGVATYTYTVTNMAEDNTDSIYATCGSITSNTLTKTWLPGPPAEIVLTQNSDTNTVGENHVLTATVKDQYGNFVADGTAVNFVVDRAGKSGTANTTGGVATYSYTVTNMAGDNTDSIYATCGSITSNTLTKTWLPGPPAEFVWSTIPSPQVAGVPFQVTITAYDQYGNLSTIFNGKANLSIANIGGVTPSETGNFINGVWTGNITVIEPWKAVVLTAQSGAAIGQSNAFDVYLKITFNLTQGWNLVSLNIVTDPNPLTVFSGLPSGWRLYTWDPIHSMYLDKNHATLSVGEGFWLWVPGATSYTLTGPANLTSTEISLSQGWNLIGTPYYYPVAWDNVQVKKGAETVSLPEAVTRGWVRTYAYYWQGGAYHTLSSGGSFEPLKGYWFYAKVSGCTLIFPPKAD